MRSSIRLAAATALSVLAVTAGLASTSSADHGGSLVRSEHLIGVRAPFLATNVPVRPVHGVTGGGLPWVLDEGELRVRADGRVRMEVEGLVIDPAAPAAGTNAGINPSPVFKVAVSCDNGDGTFTVVLSESTPATRGGDASLRTKIALPAVCDDPVAFITNGATGPALRWFAATSVG
jgi:hypothetical protein